MILAIVPRPVGRSVAFAQGALTPFRVVGWGPPLLDFADVWIAQEKGFYREEGLAVEYRAAQGSGDALTHLLAGNADIAVTAVEGLLFALDQGAKLQAVYNIAPQNQFTILARKSRGIQTAKDLKGKNIGVRSMGSGSRYNVISILNYNGLKETDANVIATGLDFATPLVQGRVDAIGTWETANWDLRNGKLPKAVVDDLVEFRTRDYLNQPSDILVVTEEFKKSHRDVLMKFLRSTRKAQKVLHEQPDEAAKIAAKYAIDGKDSAARNLEIVKILIWMQQDVGSRQNGLGWFTMPVLDRVARDYQAWGLIKSVPKATDFATNEFVTALGK
jgi:NitT/TauT family transport system substrate-binding protein